MRRNAYTPGRPRMAAILPAGGVPQVSTPKSSSWDLMLGAAAGMLLAYIWRLQGLYPILAKVQFPSLMVVVAVGIFVADRDRRRSLRSIAHPVAWAAGGMLAIAVLSVPGSLYPGLSFDFITNDFVKTLLLMVLVAAAIRTFEDVERLVRVLVLGAMLYSWYILTRFNVGMSGRLGNLIYYDANDLAFLIVSTIPLAVYLYSRRPGGRMKWVAAFGLVLFIMAIVKSGSRGGFIGLIAVGIYLLVGFNAIPKKTRMLAVSGSVLMMLAFGNSAYWNMMSTLLHPEDDYNWANDEGRGRTEIWKRGMGYMVTHPLLGVGAAAFPVAEGTLSPLAARQEYGRGLKWSASHNSFVQVGAELGVVALALFLYMLWQAFRSARGGGRLRSRGPPSREQALGHALAGSLVGYASAGFFVSMGYSAFLYALLALVVGLAKVAGSSGPSAAGRPPARGVRRPAPARSLAAR